MTDLTVTASVLAALAAAVVLTVLHLLAPRIRKLPGVPEAATGSFGGGLAVAYVFLHLLPELSEGNQAVGEALQHVVTITPLLDLAIFLVALAGFLLFYGLERLAQRTSIPTDRQPMPASVQGAAPTADWQSSNAAGTAGATASRNPSVSTEPAGSALAFRLHLGSFFVYNFLITYTMPLRFRTGVLFAVLFTVAMGLHFVLTDRGLEERYPHQFGTRGRLALAAALLAGWVLSAVLAPSSTLLVALLTALLAGSILLNVFKEEIPSDRRSSFPWFAIGLVVYAVLLAVVTAISE
jgi:hypothetical protein